MTTRLDSRSVVAAIVFLLLAAVGVRAAEAWRMAGTFNGWNTGDPGWQLVPDDIGGTLSIQRRIAPGRYQFKFVRNGDWGQGHFGAGDQPGTLATPGEDIRLRIEVEALYRVTLDVNKRRWTLGPGAVDSPVLVAHTLGEPVVGQGMVIDATPSLIPAGAQASLGVFTSGIEAKVERDPKSALRVRVLPAAAGELRARLTLRAGAKEATRELVFTVADKATAPTGTVVEFKPAPAPPEAGADAPRVWAVHLAGDFNGWALPPDSGAVAMRSREDGSFFVGMALSEGAYRYRLVLNEEQPVVDPSNPRRARADDGSACSLLVVGKEPKDFPAPKPQDINADAIRHNPSLTSDFRPISRSLGLAEISACTLPGDVEQAVVFFDADAGVIGDKADHDSGKPRPGVRRVSAAMHKTTDLSGFDRWTARIMTGLPGGSCTYALGFRDAKAEYVSKDYTVRIAPALELPAWAMGAVWYQIFPERFRNGNPLNDPHGPGVTLMPWNSDWYAISDDEAAAWKKRANIPQDQPVPPHTGGSLYNVVWDRRYGGDLQGVAEKLDYLKQLGVTAVYLNPVFQAESMHKYDATDYRHIDFNLATPQEAGRVPERWSRIMSETEDPATWTWTPADKWFVGTFIPEAHKRGMRVILDGVFNHTGRPFWAFDDIEKLGSKSPYKDWYFVEFDDAGKLKSWVSWYNTGALPKFKQQPNGDLVEPVKRHLFNVTKRWMDPNGDGDPSDGIDGWRLDVALDVGLPFWRDWRQLVKGINPDAFITAEIWDDASDVMKGDTFDTQMHYPFAKAVVDWLGVRPGTTTNQMIGQLVRAFDDAPQTNLIHQNLFCSHDTDRFVSMLFNPGRDYDGRNRVQDPDGQAYRQGRPPEPIYRKSLLGVAIQATYLGAPMVYYGDELGMYGADDPTDRKPYPWGDTGEPVNISDRPDPALRLEYARWLNLRSDPAIGPVLRYGSVRHLDAGDDGVFAFTRELNGRRVVVVVNRDERDFDAARLLPTGTSDPGVPGVSAKFWVLN